MPEKKGTTDETEIKLSVCCYCKNEEFYLPIMIASALDFADEIIIVIDSDTTDKTEEKILEFKNPDKIKYYYLNYGDNLGKAKNYAQEQATGDWIFFLDADECIHEEMAPKIKDIIKNCIERDIESVHVQYVHFIENFSKIDNSLAFHYGTNRIYKKLDSVKYIHTNHALPTINKNKMIFCPDVEIYHLGYLRGMDKVFERFHRNYTFSEMHSKFDQMMWRDWHYYGHYPTRKFLGTIPKYIRKAFGMDIIK